MSCEWGRGSERAGARPGLPWVLWGEGLGRWDASAPQSEDLGFLPDLRKDAGSTSFLLCVWGQSMWGPAAQGGCNWGKCKESLVDQVRHPRGFAFHGVCTCVYVEIGYLTRSWGQRN